MPHKFNPMPATESWIFEQGYSRVVRLSIFVDNHITFERQLQDHQRQLEQQPNVENAGLDLVVRNAWIEDDLLICDMGIACSASVKVPGQDQVFPTSFYMYPRSSLSKLPLLLANSVGIIDAGYRGNLIAKFHITDPARLKMEDVVGARLVQICGPTLEPLVITTVDTREALGVTVRGNKGFGSSGMYVK